MDSMKLEVKAQSGLNPAETPEQSSLPDGTSPCRGLVTVVIPTFNRADLLPRAVRSVLDQTYRPLELIVVDDCSEDATPLVLAPWTANEEMRVIRHEKNQGVSAARNSGIRAGRGELIAFLDSDDLLKLLAYSSIYLSNLSRYMFARIGLMIPP